ncbi:class I SAM-dependent methyltransferase [bacterium]|nr:MAG: class I SAM-dependent methyltransferase [bacterium]
MESKAWNWDIVDNDCWKNVSDEFLPTALRWKEKKLTNVLDLGCGIGRHSIFLAKNGFEVDAFDLSESGLEQLSKTAKTANLKIHIRNGDMLQLPYEDEKYDCIVAFHSIYHTDLQGLKKVISEIHRVLKTDGHLYLTLNSKESDAWKKYSNRKIDEYTLIKTDGPEVDVPHTYLDHDMALEILSLFKIDKFQQILEYPEKSTHAHFFIECTK